MKNLIEKPVRNYDIVILYDIFSYMSSIRNYNYIGEKQERVRWSSNLALKSL